MGNKEREREGEREKEDQWAPTYSAKLSSANGTDAFSNAKWSYLTHFAIHFTAPAPPAATRYIVILILSESPMSVFFSHQLSKDFRSNYLLFRQTQKSSEKSNPIRM
ncbi:hypothetical protein DPX16_8554 [Anabarilius grahami]|uniref:Uncharacterized protein n=1 Tax=Anabarilius grahami TaxID=495550 RepID=A0A3N0YAN0_ANAGA|nr:hypothetical protein DPX16_8554 [Anabarilius grahami]